MTPPGALFANNAQIVASTTDPYMSVDEAKALQASLGVPMHLLEDAGHINADSGYGEWPWILEQVKRCF